MINTYSEFEDRIVDMLKIRSRNYAHSDCEIRSIINTVYEDIQNTVLLEVYKQPYTVSKDELVFTLRNNNAPLSQLPNGEEIYDESKATEVYRDVLEIVNKDDLSIMHLLHLTELPSTWMWNTYAPCNTCQIPDCFDGEEIYFIRKKISDIEHLPGNVYTSILNAMLEGCMYYIQTAIPSGMDEREGNMSYQRFYNAKKALFNIYPQHIYAVKGEWKWA